MSDEDALGKMIERLLTQFTPPEFGWELEAIKLLSDIPDNALDAAATSILKTRKYRDFPSIYDIREAAGVWIAAQRAASIRQTPRVIDGRECTSETEARAITALKTDLGKRAASEGWAAGLFQYVYNHGRMPDSSEQMTIRREQDRLLDSAEKYPQFALAEMHMAMETRYAGIAGASDGK